MSRRLFKTQDQIDDENELARRMGIKRGVAFLRQPDRYFVDFVGFRGGKPVAVMEAKRRVGVLRHPNYMVSYLKTMRGIELSQALGVPFIYLIDAGDELGETTLWCQVTPDTVSSVGWFGPEPPRDGEDHELAAIIDWEAFGRIELPAARETETA